MVFGGGALHRSRTTLPPPMPQKIIPEVDASEIHPDHTAPMADQITIRTQKAMAVAIRRRALTRGGDVSAVVRALIRAGAPHLPAEYGGPLNISASAL